MKKIAILSFGLLSGICFGQTNQNSSTASQENKPRLTKVVADPAKIGQHNPAEFNVSPQKPEETKVVIAEPKTVKKETSPSTESQGPK